MKGLLLKDLYMIRAYFKSYALLLVGFLGVSVISDNMFFIFYPCLLCSMIPVNLMAYEERAKWDVYAGTMPISKAQIVSSKYLLGILGQVLVFICVALVLAYRLFVMKNLDPADFGNIMGMLLALCCITMAIPLAFVFKMGVEKGRMAYYFMVGVSCAGIFLATAWIMDSETIFKLPLYLFILGAMVLFAGSWVYSIRIYEKREIA